MSRRRGPRSRRGTIPPRHATPLPLPNRTPIHPISKIPQKTSPLPGHRWKSTAISQFNTTASWTLLVAAATNNVFITSRITSRTPHDLASFAPWRFQSSYSTSLPDLRASVYPSVASCEEGRFKKAAHPEECAACFIRNHLPRGSGILCSVELLLDRRHDVGSRRRHRTRVRHTRTTTQQPCHNQGGSQHLQSSFHRFHTDQKISCRPSRIAKLTVPAAAAAPRRGSPNCAGPPPSASM